MSLDYYAEDIAGTLADLREAGAKITIVRKPPDDVGNQSPWFGDDGDPLSIVTYALLVPEGSNEPQGSNFVTNAIIAGIDENGIAINPPLTSEDSITGPGGEPWQLELLNPLAPDGENVVLYLARLRQWPAH